MMPASQDGGVYTRELTPIERLFTRSPFSIVTMVARIQGGVTEGMLRGAVAAVRRRHANLRVRIVEDAGGRAWLTSEGAGEIAVDVVPRQGDEQWLDVAQAACQVPFEFDARPAIRLILVQAGDRSDLVIVCHHILCDGLSLAYLARDLLAHMEDPAREVEVLPDPVPIDLDSMPRDVSVNAVVRFALKRMNKKWQGEKIVFDQEDYRQLARAYWSRYRHQALPVELSEAQTSALVERCKSHGVTVNSALTAAFAGAQTIVQGEQPHHAAIGVAASLRDRLRTPAGEAMGFYAGLATLRHRYDGEKGFWDNAGRFHEALQPLLTNKNLFQNPALWCHLDPTILEAVNFKKLGGLVAEEAGRHQKLSAFGRRDDVVLAILKRDGMESPARITMGTAVTNLTRLDFPRAFGRLELERLILKPGGAFPLANVNLVLGAVTCAGRLSLVIEFVEDNVDRGTMDEIKGRALEFCGCAND